MRIQIDTATYASQDLEDLRLVDFMPALTVGDPAPWFTPTAIAPTPASNQTPSQDFKMGGYRAVLFFFGSGRNPQIQAVLSKFSAAKALFESLGVHFFGVSIDPNDRVLEQQVPSSAYFHWLWDFTGEISIRYGLCELGAGKGVTYDPTTFVLSENLRVLGLFPLETHVAHVEQVLNFLQALPQPNPSRRITQQAPVLIIPEVFQPEFCQSLIRHYETNGGSESGFMRQDGEKTVVVLDPTIKRRRDWLITDAKLLQRINGLIGRRVVPEIEKAFQFRVTCFERYVVACYEATNQGFFQAHRDNLAVGTAHRRFAMTLNLNASYEGGCLRFSEYGTDLYTSTAGSAIVFSCSLLHEATPVTAGQRFVLLSFFYGDADSQRRERTQAQIVRSGVAPYVGNNRIR